MVKQKKPGNIKESLQAFRDSGKITDEVYHAFMVSLLKFAQAEYGRQIEELRLQIQAASEEIKNHEEWLYANAKTEKVSLN